MTRIQIWRTPEDIPADLGRTVVTVGVFDGVHRGHHAVLAETVHQARERGLTSVALTFDPHPAIVHHPERPIRLVATVDDRIDRLAAAGIEAVYVQHYTLDYAQATAREFVEKQLLGQLHAGIVVVGEDVRFGKNNAGDGKMLTELGRELGFDVVLLDDRGDNLGRRWSSTWIRELLELGDVAQVAQILGRAHRLRGEVVHGFQRGRDLGFPTANLKGESLGEVPADGVYAGWLVRNVPGTNAVEYLPSAISVGTNPQFDGVTRTVEAHVLGRTDLDLYGHVVDVEFTDRIREMETFGSLEEFLERLALDIEESADLLGVPRPARPALPAAAEA